MAEIFADNALGYVTFKRTYARKPNDDCDDTESWSELMRRLMFGIKNQLKVNLLPNEEKELYNLMYYQKISLAGRFLWQLGTSNVNKTGLLTLQNCSGCVCDDYNAFTWSFMMLMMGCGVGINIQREHVDKLPIVKESHVKRMDTNDADFIIPDSRNGWVALLRRFLKSHFITGHSFTYSCILLRSKGAPIKSFGGTASGPDVLCKGIEQMEVVLNSRIGQKMRPIDCLDIIDIIGSVVVAGNVRRSAIIALGDYNDDNFLKAKRFDLGDVPNWRCFSNNSVVCNDVNKLPPLFWETYTPLVGEPLGLVNIDLIRQCGRLGDFKHTDPDVVSLNPCGEQPLNNKETCCLGEIILPNIKSKEELWLATRFVYRVCKHSLLLPAPQLKDTETIVHKNMRMGISIGGYMQSTEEQKSWLSDNYTLLRDFDRVYSEIHGIPKSIKLTTIKPSGTIGLVTGVTPGLHAAYSKHYIRRVRIASESPLVRACKLKGFNVVQQKRFDGSIDPVVSIVEFPCKAHDNAVCADNISAIDQIEVLRRLQTEWSDNACSITVTYKREELDDIVRYLVENYTKNIKSISFLLHSEHGFVQAPYEKITKQQYDILTSKVQKIQTIQDCLKLQSNTSAVTYYKIEENLLESSCVGGICPIR